MIKNSSAIIKLDKYTIHINDQLLQRLSVVKK